MTAPAQVTAVVCAAFDPATEHRVLAIRELARELGLQLPEAPAHRPHLTLAATRLPDERLPALLDVVGAIAAQHRPLRLHLSEVGQFARSGVLWLGPERDKALHDLQRAVFRALKGAGYASAFTESTPYRWVPHCTLATRVPRPLLRSVRESLIDEVEPFDATITAFATILVGGRGDVGYAPLPE